MAEKDLLKAQLDMEKRSSQQLHSVISAERQREFHAQNLGREKEEEITQLRQLLTKLEADRSVLWVLHCEGVDDVVSPAATLPL